MFFSSGGGGVRRTRESQGKGDELGARTALARLVLTRQGHQNSGFERRVVETSGVSPTGSSWFLRVSFLARTRFIYTNKDEKIENNSHPL